MNALMVMLLSRQEFRTLEQTNCGFQSNQSRSNANICSHPKHPDLSFGSSFKECVHFSTHWQCIFIVRPFSSRSERSLRLNDTATNLVRTTANGIALLRRHRDDVVCMVRRLLQRSSLKWSHRHAVVRQRMDNAIDRCDQQHQNVFPQKSKQRRYCFY